MDTLTQSNPAAAKLIEEYIECGFYQELKSLTQEKDCLNKLICDYLISYEWKRHEIGNHLVAKFIPKQIYDYDYPGLNEFLYDRGLLQKLTKLTSTNLNKDRALLEMFAPYSEPPAFFIKPTLNNVGKELVKINPLEDFALTFTLEEASKRKRENLLRLKAAKHQYEMLKKALGTCQQLLAAGKINHKYGSVSRVQKPCVYQTDNVTDKLLVQQLIQYGKPDMNSVMEYAAKQYFSRSEIEPFRKLTDIKLSLVILDLDDEAKMMNF